MFRLFPASTLDTLRTPRWVLLVMCLLLPSSVLRTAHNWQDFLHAVSPISPQHHEEHHTAGHFHDTDHSHEPDADTEHHREHHAQHDHHSHDQALLSAFKWYPSPQQSVFTVPVAVLVQAFVPPTPRELHPFGRDGPQVESPPAQHLSLPLSGRSPPVV